MNTTSRTSKSFAAWYEGLSDRERTAYARRAKTTRGYIESHLLAPYKIPRAAAMENLARASQNFTVAELAAWFYESSLARRGRRPRAQC